MECTVFSKSEDEGCRDDGELKNEIESFVRPLLMGDEKQKRKSKSRVPTFVCVHHKKRLIKWVKTKTEILNSRFR